mmetsp:Transcript_12421/g.19439  ORF Transcript_12421/g.19439 Transcript_12421/m.19439 type:complete len:103 (-) Transcript_12421:542-850(-)
MNNFYIDIVCQAYLDTKSGLSAEENQINEKRIQDIELEIERQSEEWRNNAIIAFEKETFQLYRFAMRQVDKQRKALQSLEEKPKKTMPDTMADDEDDSYNRG